MDAFRLFRFSNPLDKDLEKGYNETIKVLQKYKIPYSVIGGIAMQEYREPRYTGDADFIVLSTNAEYIKQVFIKHGYRLYDEHSNKDMFNSYTLRFKCHSIGIDILISNSQFYKDTIRLSKKGKKSRGKIAPIEALIPLKCIAFENRMASHDPGVFSKGWQDETDYKQLIIQKGYSMKLLKHFSELAGKSHEIAKDILKYRHYNKGV